jgi:hypothetical protein
MFFKKGILHKIKNNPQVISFCLEFSLKSSKTKKLKKKDVLGRYSELHFTFYYLFCSILKKHPEVPEKFFI